MTTYSPTQRAHTSPSIEEAMAAWIELDEYQPPPGYRGPSSDALAKLRQFIESTATGLDAAERAILDRLVLLVRMIDSENIASDENTDDVEFELHGQVRALLAARAGDKT